MPSQKKERRKYPRVADDRVSMKVRSEGGDIITRSTNISASGIYCKSDSRLPIMSRVRVTLMLPVPSDKESATKIVTEGVVVREHPVIIDNKIDHYDAAIFFDNLLAKDKEAINYYVAQRT